MLLGLRIVKRIVGGKLAEAMVARHTLLEVFQEAETQIHPMLKLIVLDCEGNMNLEASLRRIPRFLHGICNS